MENIKKNFGFGCMRLPMKDGEIDLAETSRMVDYFLEQGFNYFDTAHGYLQGRSETALKACLTSRHPRDSYILTDKLTGTFFKTEADIRPFFQSQLEACGVDYFDFYLMHAQSAMFYQHFKKCRAYETAFALKAEGKIKHVGISFHDHAEVLEQILTDYPEIEVVQIQFNYVDYDDPAVQSRKCYEVCRRHGKPVLVMEPVKGGNLVNLPEEARKVLDELHGGSPASYAIRFAAGFPGMMMVHKLVRQASRKCDIAYEFADGSVAYDDIPDPLPFDLNAPIVEIGEDDFGIWYMDCQDEPQKYVGKTVRFLAQVCQTNRAGKNSFVPGRFAMTCCVQDIQFVGFPCSYDGYKALEQRAWVTVTAKVNYKFHNIYRGKGPVLTAISVEPAEKPQYDVVALS